MKTIRTYGNAAEAGFAASLLEAAEIKTLLKGEESFLLTPGMAASGIQLQVEEEDEEKALGILEGGFDAADRPRAGIPSPNASTHGKGNVPVGLFVAVAVGLLLIWLAIRQTRAHEAAPASPREWVQHADFNHDGKSDLIYYYRGDIAVRSEADRNRDGRMDEWTTFDDEGRPKTDDLDQNFDGRPDLWWVFDRGRVESWRRDTDFDGRPDWFGRCENGQEALAECRPGDSQIITRREIYMNAVLVEEQVDENLDGAMDYRILFDPFGGTIGTAALESRTVDRRVGHNSMLGSRPRRCLLRQTCRRNLLF